MPPITRAPVLAETLNHLLSALAKLDLAAHQMENVPAEQNPATAHLFIVNPLSGERMDNSLPIHRPKIESPP